MNYDLGWGKLTSTTSYRDRHSFLAFDADGLDAAELAILKAAGGAATIADINTASLSDDRTRTAYEGNIHLAGEHGGLPHLAGEAPNTCTQLDGFIATVGKTPTKASDPQRLRHRGLGRPDSVCTSWAATGLVGLRHHQGMEHQGRGPLHRRPQAHRGQPLRPRSTGLQSGGAGFTINSTYVSTTIRPGGASRSPPTSR